MGRMRSAARTVTQASVCVMGLSGPAAVSDDRLAPKIETIEPGATAFCGVAAAALVTPDGAMYGALSMMARTRRGALICSVPVVAVPLRSPVQLRKRKPGCAVTVTATDARAS